MDLLVELAPERTLIDLTGFQQDAGEILGVRVDAIAPRFMKDRVLARALRDARVRSSEDALSARAAEAAAVVIAPMTQVPRFPEDRDVDVDDARHRADDDRDLSTEVERFEQSVAHPRTLPTSRVAPTS